MTLGNAARVRDCSTRGGLAQRRRRASRALPLERRAETYASASLVSNAIPAIAKRVLRAFYQRQFIEWLLTERRIFEQRSEAPYPPSVRAAIYPIVNPQPRPVRSGWGARRAGRRDRTL